MTDHQMCPWCLTDIIWDEEIGPETHCPHCENELSGYRTVQLGMDEDEQDHDLVDSFDTEEDRNVESKADQQSEKSSWMDEDDGYRTSSRSRIAAESVAQQIIDLQDEAPECAVCREYMLEAGTQTIGGDDFKAAIASPVQNSIVNNPFQVVWYVCPSCFHTSTMLSPGDRNAMLEKLTPND